MSKDRAMLEAFVVNNQELEKLETLLAEFNIFEAIGAVRHELRHSDFLAFLLDPAQNHNLGDIFLKRFLKNLLINTTDPAVSAIDIDIADFREATVEREWRRVDILIHAPAHKIVCAIENKIDSGEHSGQLQRYQAAVKREFPGYRQIFVFLTPEGDEPSAEEYIPFDYSAIAKLVDSVHQAHKSTLGTGVSTLMAHYTDMLRRHIVSDSKIAELCQKIYQRHQKALDLIFEHLPDLQTDLSGVLKTLVEQDAKAHKLELNYSSKRYVEFYPTEWDTLPPQLNQKKWDMKDMPLYFLFGNTPDQLQLRLYLLSNYPKPIIRTIHEMALANPRVFKYTTKRLGAKRTQIYRKEFLRSNDYVDAELETLEEKVKAGWQEFLNKDLPAIQNKLDQITWPAPDQVKG